jgi:hypothetical protein
MKREVEILVITFYGIQLKTMKLSQKKISSFFSLKGIFHHKRDGCRGWRIESGISKKIKNFLSQNIPQSNFEWHGGGSTYGPIHAWYFASISNRFGWGRAIISYKIPLMEWLWSGNFDMKSHKFLSMCMCMLFTQIISANGIFKMHSKAPLYQIAQKKFPKFSTHHHLHRRFSSNFTPRLKSTYSHLLYTPRAIKNNFSISHHWLHWRSHSHSHSLSFSFEKFTFLQQQKVTSPGNSHTIFPMETRMRERESMTCVT